MSVATGSYIRRGRVAVATDTNATPPMLGAGEEEKINAAEGTDASAVRARFGSLTQREVEVLECIVGGGSNKTIARQLDISPRTVEFHRANVMQKMQTKSLAELIRSSVITNLFQDIKG